MRMRTLYVLAGTLTFVFSLLLLAPAATVYGWIKPRLGDTVTLAGVDGNLRDGSAAAVMVGGRPLVEKLHWKLGLGELLLARLGVDFESSGATLMAGHLSKGFGVVRARDLRIASNLKALLGAFGQPFAPLDGQASLELSRLKMLGNWPTDAEGSLRIQGLAWTLARDPVVLGDYQADIKPDGNDIIALVHTLGGSLDVNGDARAKPDRSYELHLQLRPRGDAPPLVMNLLRSLGSPDPQGYYHLRREGKLP
ncbi:type II secretion system protein N [Solimonas terrae]|uniref:Type II secretion system protein N n=1 Tax=Solimonas terrae TaxID=1396819 RepID=A0A6M2BVM6_9GAMM|nr:type II secretion system protein N [Solimonas terrae]NGY06305.1 type II secretion system protein N [Solimonas terrae]